MYKQETGQLVCMVKGYGLQNQDIMVRFSTEARKFSRLQKAQTGCGAHLSSSSMDDTALSARLMQPKCEADNSPPSRYEV